MHFDKNLWKVKNEKEQSTAYYHLGPRYETNEITKEEFNDQWRPFSIIDDANRLQVLI